MTSVKFTSEKWWVLHQESWIEINQKDWEKVKRETWMALPTLENATWQPDPERIYSLPEEVEFEIRYYTPQTGTNIAKGSTYPYSTVKVAHLKDSEPQKKQTVEEYEKQGMEKYFNMERSEEVKKEPKTDSDKLELLATWHDQLIQSISAIAMNCTIIKKIKESY